ncbi:MAG: ROK family protein [Verrucomicrobiae bacterium]|nr:ROK family protein [Verrucomicrobiae bacterium]
MLIGMDFGGTKKVDGVIDPLLPQPVIRMRRYKTRNMLTNAELLEETRRSLQEFGATPQNCVIGISAAGAIDREKLLVLHSPNTKIPPPLDFAARLREEGYRVVIGNDLAMAAYGVGTLNGTGNAVVITFSSGMNTGVMVEGKLLEAETGHCEYPYASDWPWSTPPSCNCPGSPSKRCVEAFASGNGAGRMFRAAFMDGLVKPDHPVFTHLIRQLNEDEAEGGPFKPDDLLRPARRDMILDHLTSEAVYAAHATHPDQITDRIRLIQERAIAHVLKDAVLHYGRQKITIIGGLTHWWDLLFMPAIERAKHEGSNILPMPPVEKCPYPEPCLVGAALYARDVFGAANGEKHTTP